MIRFKIDKGLCAGAVVVIAAVACGIASTGVSLEHFFQPSGALIVIGGTLGVTLLTTPIEALRNSLCRVKSLASRDRVDRARLIDEIVALSRSFRREASVVFEASIRDASQDFLRNGLILGLDTADRAELQITLEAEIRLRERQGESDAKTLETVGAFAPTIGIVGTVVGLIDILRQFSSVQSVGLGVGTAFVSTIYGLGLANFLLLPLAHRMRARVAEEFETQELMLEGILCIFSRLHPALIRQRLNPYLRDGNATTAIPASGESGVLVKANGAGN